ncbi:rhodanese-like domain-containing protein [Paenibacillus rhizovicinus]|uniref:Rhodanese-like domain-containing protein n=1 Tax=Paenibacillus rhizovicinus TaxID=2704463 RepID=A0A6C0P3E2_9BACL|nr:rhodanese-like domain-containing protein [Paenibacillus rhizovicinus]QHW32353.1 rhodanese-like domain-containing protein [Paenibacillus rhizovicinus]
MKTIIDVLFILAIAWFIYSRFGPAKGLRTLKEPEFRTAAEQTGSSLLVDVREPAEFKSGFIAGARNIPLSQLGRRLNELPKDRDLLLYCRSGMRSKQAARMLQKNGFTRLSHLQGGIGAWSQPLDRRG